MSDGKGSGKQSRDTGAEDALLRRAAADAGASPLTQGGNTPLFDDGKGDPQINGSLREGLPHLTDPASLQDSLARSLRALSQQRKLSSVYRCTEEEDPHTTSQDPTTQPVLLTTGDNMWPLMWTHRCEN